jgi:hypothetical protein
MSNEPGENGTQNKESLKKKIIIPVISSILAVFFYDVLFKVDLAKLIRQVGGLTERAHAEMPVFSAVDFADEIKEGKYIRYSDIGRHNTIGWGKDEDLLLQMGLKPDREVFMKTIRVKFRSMLDIHAHAGGKFDSHGQQDRFGMVMTRIKVNGIEYAKDNATFNGAAVCPLFSSTSCAKILEPGEYRMLVEGIFCGSVENHDAWMQMKITRVQDVPYGELAKVKEAGYYPVSHGFAEAERKPEWFYSLVIGQ